MLRDATALAGASALPSQKAQGVALVGGEVKPGGACVLGVEEIERVEALVDQDASEREAYRKRSNDRHDAGKIASVIESLEASKATGGKDELWMLKRDGTPTYHHAHVGLFDGPVGVKTTGEVDSSGGSASMWSRDESDEDHPDDAFHGDVTPNDLHPGRFILGSLDHLRMPEFLKDNDDEE